MTPRPKTAQRLRIEMINLTRATERRALMESELFQAGLRAEFHPAFDFRVEGQDALLRHCAATGPWGPFHPGNMAVTISHGQVWERFLKSDATHCAVFEDDVFLSPDLSDWLGDLGWWPEDAHLVKLERWRANRLKVLLEAGGTQHLGRSLRRMMSRHVGAAGYVIDRRGAEIALRHRPFRQPVDNYLFNANASPAARAMRIYQVIPALVVQGNEPAGAPPSIGPRAKPTGLARWSQKIKRGYFEVAYPLPTFIQYLSGALRLEPIPYAAHAGVPIPNTET